ncbi:hypothetical protein AB4259_02735 [Vibrio amylolyticus]|uniref:hypothetical protein n=1 Tax=Vibrio amylolyticus TaxID=2847292 RepID=UPI003554190B
MEEFSIPNTQMVVDHHGNLYDYHSHSIITSEVIRIGDHTIRTKALIANTYLSHGRVDLLKRIDKPVYLIISPNGAKYYSLNLAEFSREHGLPVENMYKAAQKGYQTREGWKVESLN